MNRLLPLSLVFVLSASSLTYVSCTGPTQRAQVDTTYTITVAMRGLDSGKLILNYADGDEARNDTATSTTGIYQFSGKSPEPKRGWLLVYGAQRGSLIFFIENGKITINAHRDSLRDGVASGTKSNDEYRELQRMLVGPNAKYKSMLAAYSKTTSENVDTRDSLMKVYEGVEQEKRSISGEFIKSHPASYASIYQVYDLYVYDPDVVPFEIAYGQLDSTLQRTTVGKELRELLEIAKRTDLNQVAPDFTANDVNGAPVTLTSLRGKYVLIDFWASWCGPCREENPNLVRSYKTYNKLGFEILGVSLDFPNQGEKWKEAIRKDKLTWLHVSDLQGFRSAVAKQYGINSIPMNYLLDPEGRIVAKDLRGSDLDKKLETLLKGG